MNFFRYIYLEIRIFLVTTINISLNYIKNKIWELDIDAANSSFCHEVNMQLVRFLRQINIIIL